jgi:hypothetical protein
LNRSWARCIIWGSLGYRKEWRENQEWVYKSIWYMQSDTKNFWKCATGISVMIPLSQGMCNRDAISQNMCSSNVQTTPPSFWKSAVMNITHEIGVL